MGWIPGGLTWLLSLTVLVGATQLAPPDDLPPARLTIPLVTSNVERESMVPGGMVVIGVSASLAHPGPSVPAKSPTSGMVTAAQDVSAAGGPLSGSQRFDRDGLRQLLRDVQAPEGWIEDLVTIAWCESSGQSWVWNTNGEDSRGLWQLWSGWFPAAGYSLADWQDPHVNAATALYVRETRGRYGGIGGWSCADKHGIY